MATATVTTTANITVIQTSTRKRGEFRVKIEDLVYQKFDLVTFAKVFRQVAKSPKF